MQWTVWYRLWWTTQIFWLPFPWRTEHWSSFPGPSYLEAGWPTVLSRLFLWNLPWPGSRRKLPHPKLAPSQGSCHSVTTLLELRRFRPSLWFDFEKPSQLQGSLWDQVRHIYDGITFQLLPLHNPSSFDSTDVLTPITQPNKFSAWRSPSLHLLSGRIQSAIVGARNDSKNNLQNETWLLNHLLIGWQ